MGVPALEKSDFAIKKVAIKNEFSIAVSLSLVIREAKLHLKYESSFILSYP